MIKLFILAVFLGVFKLSAAAASGIASSQKPVAVVYFSHTNLNTSFKQILEGPLKGAFRPLGNAYRIVFFEDPFTKTSDVDLRHSMIDGFDPGGIQLPNGGFYPSPGYPELKGKLRCNGRSECSDGTHWEIKLMPKTGWATLEEKLAVPIEKSDLLRDNHTIMVLGEWRFCHTGDEDYCEPEQE